MLRLFVGIEFSPELKLRLSLLETALTGARWIDPGNLHLTLRFIGEVTEDRAADVDEAMAELTARRFPLQLAGTGVFGGNKPHTLWVGAERGPDLVALHDKIERALIRIGLAPEPRRFAPHVTLARLRHPDPEKLAEWLSYNALATSAEFPVEAFHLYSSRSSSNKGASDGSIYAIEEDYPLGGHEDEEYEPETDD